jgi:predicted RNase H-like nuclease (RuvC/YqgF family)
MEPDTMSRREANDQETGGYRSPARVLAPFFERSRDLWKAKYKELQDRVKAFRTESRDLRRSRDRWRTKAEDLERKIEKLHAKLRERVGQSPPAPSQQS